MKRLPLINAKKLTDVEASARDKTLSLLEEETFAWAKGQEAKAFKLTKKVKREFEKDPSSENKKKYFKYLRKLLMLKIERAEEQAYKNNEDPPKYREDLSKILNIQKLRVPEHISCSSMGLYEMCPRKYYYRYILGIKFPKTAALHFGNAVDEALNFYFGEKINKRVPPIKAVHNSFQENLLKDKDEVNWGKENPKVLLKNGPVVIDKYLEEFDRITDPIDVQTEVRIPLDNNGLLLGYIDILEEDEVVDTKTAKKRWNDSGRYAKKNKELQPRAYSLWFLEHFEKMPNKFRYQIVTKETDAKGRATPDAQLVHVNLKKFELETFRRRIQKVWDDILEQLNSKDEKGNLYGMEMFPAQAEVGPDSGRGVGCQEPIPLCTQQWCDYSELCLKQGLKVPKRWVSKTKDTPGHHIY